MRLIDADEFKERILSGEFIYCQVNKEDIADAIDNAPTVTPTFGLFRDMLCSDCEKRPQGEWYKTGQSFINPNKFKNYGCSNCFYELDEHIRIKPNFCPNCGADMRGEEK